MSHQYNIWLDDEIKTIIDNFVKQEYGSISKYIRCLILSDLLSRKELVSKYDVLKALKLFLV